MKQFPHHKLAGKIKKIDMDNIKFRENIHNLLVTGQIEKALLFLLMSLKHSENTRAYEASLLLKGRWENAKQEQLLGVVSRQEYELTVNKIMAGIKDVTNEIDQIHSFPKKTQNTVTITLSSIVLIVMLSWILFTKVNTPSQPVYTQHPYPGSQQETQKDNFPTSDLPTGQRLHSKTVAPLIEAKPSKKAEDLIIEVLVSNIDVQLFVDGARPHYHSNATGIVRKIALSEGSHTIEIIDGQYQCKVDQIITSSTSRIFPSCN